MRFACFIVKHNSLINKKLFQRSFCVYNNSFIENNSCNVRVVGRTYSVPKTKVENRNHFGHWLRNDRREFTTSSNLLGAEDVLKQQPNDFVKCLEDNNISRCFIVNYDGEVTYSNDVLKTLLPEEALTALGFEHEAIFFNVGARSKCLLAAFLWRTNRGQGVGGVHFIPFDTMGEMILDGNRFSKALGIKSALAGLWAGGGKGIIASPANKQFDLCFRRDVFKDFGDFLTSLNGCMVVGAGVGSSVQDMDTIFTQTRYTSNIPPEFGGAVNTYVYTGLGVVKAMEAAIEFLGLGSLKGKTVAIQGAGVVGQVIISELLQQDVKHIYVSECNGLRAGDISDMFAQKADGRLTVSKVSFEDTSIFQTPCDIFAPCARGKVLNETTIPLLDTKIICGAANIPVCTEEDHQALKERKITYVTGVVPNRMGIVNKMLEHYGRMYEDPDLLKHLSYDWHHSIYQTTLRILRMAEEHNIHPEKAAYILGEELSSEDNPEHPNRTHNIIQQLIDSGWHEGKDYWKENWSFTGGHSLE